MASAKTVRRGERDILDLLDPVGLNLKGVPAKARLEASGSFNSMVSHRVRIEKASEIDQQLVSWLKQAYDAA